MEIQTSDKKELDAEVVTMQLRKAMGANCKFPSVYRYWQYVDLVCAVDDRQQSGY